MQLYRYFVSQSSEFCRHSPLCCFSTSVYFSYLFRYRLSPETFGYTLVRVCLTWSTHREGPSSLLGQSVWALWWIKCHWGRLSPVYIILPLQFIVPTNLRTDLSSSAVNRPISVPPHSSNNNIKVYTSQESILMCVS
jgi:hypothetical protein